MKKTKKIIFGATTVTTAILAPIATVISCGAKGISTYDTENDGQIVINAGFGSTSNQKRALVTAIEEYNSQMKDEKGFMKVKFVPTEGGYGKMAPDLGTKIQAKKTKGMPNILIEYADALGIVNKYKFALDLNKTTPKFDKNLIENQFMDINSRIGGADSTGTYMIPLGKSTEMIGVNKVLVKMVLKDAGYVAGKNPKLDAIFKDSNLDGDIESAHNKVGWKIDASKKQAILDNASDKIFDAFKDLMAFSDAIANAYNLSPEGDKVVVGNDAPTNLIYSLAYQKAGYDMDKFLFTRDDGEKGYINYKMLKNGTEQNKIFKSILGEINNHVKTGALKLAGGGEYTSSSMQQHHTIFSIGSTAGYSHLFTSGKTLENVIEFAKDEKNKNVDLGTYGRFVVHYDASKKQVIGQKSSSNYKNPFVEKDSSIKYANIVEKDVLDFLKKNVTGSKEFVLIKVEKDQVDNIPKFKDEIFIKSSKNTKYILVPKANATISKKTPTETLQENEVMAFPGIKKYSSTDKKQMAFAQGPSFVAVHANGPEDNATAMFLNWFYNQNSKTTKDWKGKHGQFAKKGSTIVEAFDRISGYITPIKGFVTKLNDIFNKNVDKYSKGTQIAFNSYKEQVTKTGTGSIFFAPVDDYSASLRQILSSKGKSIYTNAHTGKASDVDKIYKGILLSAKTSKII